MSNNIIRYNNGLNTVPLRRFSPKEMDIFWAICSKMKRKGTDITTFDFDTFKELAHYDRKNKIAFHEALKQMWASLRNLTFVFEDDNFYSETFLFQYFEIDKINEQVKIQTSFKFEFILNSISSDFTRFELENMTKLSSSYSKELYRQLMQHRDKVKKNGAWFVRTDDFRDSLSIPKSYRMSDIDKRIFEVAKKEFTTPDNNGNIVFESCEVRKVKARKGNKIASFRIYFQEPKPFMLI